MIGGSWLIDKGFSKRVGRRYERYDIQAGILKNSDHRPARSRFTTTGKVKKGGGLTTVDGMPARRKGPIMTASAFTPSVAEISAGLRRRTRVNIYAAPFRGRPSREVKRFLSLLYKMFGAKKTSQYRKRAEEALIAAITAPIKARKYGQHSRAWQQVKGFQRRFVDTGQLYKAITARIKPIAGGGKSYGPFQQQ